MNIANWCVLSACLLPIVTIGLAKAASARRGKADELYDNHDPRSWSNALKGWQQRANAAQNNGWEALPLFCAAVILAQQGHAEQARVDQLAMLFIGLRIVYIAAYLANLATLRTLLFSAGISTSIAILLLS
ncbi:MULTISPECIES: MAPEG family protein [unclassified Undibacterium]|uniref:MAPEG family protein n=1 Tax=unclassified Undibacterium TaxID=2630295 RepID=UPI002AC8ABA0|nr:MULTISPECIES: MAPEG family protein [unclassified Undibacterium]MEB0138876.1 MAPEG family protein [Undibacterium sp. CCC2.1]MEB0172262.1 MAPEG family protein [Undibacterium sp. CCC1.1]MEB0176121.1 MAPEG family protein [Undibacterium sp. CCC3.4]MEB0215918.1 MAPEG family protein [Undibacterium sp. 5I2]WPX44738.1 MAPEG family protein [Undibacterium sp. CCC3.4]